MTQTRPENLALNFQEVFTATVRLRSNRQAISDAESFRRHTREALKTAAAEAQRSGYPMEDVKLATFAAVAFLDESILNSRNPLFAGWLRKPLQEELFGVHVAGETFFVNLQQLLGRNDSPQLADLLEVYYLCLLLGYGGRYSISGKGELRSLMETTAAKIRRIRGDFRGLSPDWRLPAEAIQAPGADPWLRGLMLTAAASLALALLLFAIFKIALGSAMSDLRVIV